MVVAGDRLPSCMTIAQPDERASEVAQDSDVAQDPGGIKCWSLDARGLSTEERLDELEQQCKVGEHGLWLLQETWRPTIAERLQIGDWIFYGTGRKEAPMGEWHGDHGAQSHQCEVMAPYLPLDHGS